MRGDDGNYSATVGFATWRINYSKEDVSWYIFRDSTFIYYKPTLKSAKAFVLQDVTEN